MIAAVLKQLPSQCLEVESVETPSSIAAGDLLVRVTACGICGTDVHILNGESYRPSLPFILGHEPVGTVVALGADVDPKWLGRRVTITLFSGCGACSYCKTGQERLCPQLVSISGVSGAWGGYAQYMVVHAAQLVDVPSLLSDLQVATLVDCGATAANAAGVALHARPDRVAVIGAGPIGFITAQLVHDRAVVCEVVEVSEARRQAMHELGFPVADAVDQLRERPDVIVDCTGNRLVTNESLDALRPGGTYVAAGYSVVPEFQLPMVARKELTIRGVRSGSRADLVNVLDLAATSRIALPAVQSWPLAGINDAFASLRASQVLGKAVIVLPPTQSGKEGMVT